MGRRQETLFPNQLMQERVASYIEEALAARGFKRVPSGGDLLISYRINVTQEPVYTTFSDGFGPGWGRLGFGMGKRMGKRLLNHDSPELL